MIVKEPPTAVVMRSLQQLEGLLPLLDEITDPPSVAAIACRIAGLAATIADKTTTPEFAREVILIESGGCTPWLPGENTPQAAKNFVDELTGMMQEPAYFDDCYAATLYRSSMTDPVKFATIHSEQLITKLLREGFLMVEHEA